MTIQSISVVIPLFSSERFARKSIESVLGQTLKPKELILVDDSKKSWINKGYLDLISSHGIEIVYRKNSTNLGSSASLNSGMLLAKGNIVCLLNDDDVFAENRLNEILRISSSSDLEFFWGFSPVSLIDLDGNRLNTSGFTTVDTAVAESHSKSIDFASLEFSNSAVSSGNLFISKRLFDMGYRFDESLNHVQDWYLVQRLFLKSDPKIVQNTTYFYRIHQKNSFKGIDPQETKLECDLIHTKIRTELWTNVNSERLLQLLSHKVIDQKQSGSSMPRAVNVVNYRAYAIVDFFISKFYKRAFMFRLITLIGKKLERLIRS